jgi:hypothetical protein
MNSRELFKKTLQVANDRRLAFVPFVFGLAARIDQTPLAEMVLDPTNYANLLDGAQKLLQQDAIIASFDPNLEAEIFGCQTDWQDDYKLPIVTTWSDCNLESVRIESSSRIAVMLEAIKRLVVTRSKDVGIIGVVTGPCSLATCIAQNAKLDKNYAAADISSLTGDRLIKLTKSICEAKVDAIIFREDRLAEKYPAELASQAKSYAAVYTTLFNLTRFYNIASLILMHTTGLADVEEVVKKLRPNGIILSGKRFDTADLMRLKSLSEAQKISVGLPLPMHSQDEMVAQYRVIDEFVKDNHPKGFFYTSEGEVPTEIALETLYDLVAEIKAAQEA